MLLGSLDTAKLAERAWVRSSMGALRTDKRVLISFKNKIKLTNEGKVTL